MLPKEVDAPNRELARLAEGLANTFIQRWELYARQLEDGQYVCIQKPLKPAHVLAHLRGDLTLGAYVLDPYSRARFLVFDADDEEHMRQLVSMDAGLEKECIPAYLEASRRGGHLWMFFPGDTDGKDVRAFGFGLQARFQLAGIEMFPKQDLLKEGPGSLIRLPFGIHRKTGQRYGFLTPGLQPLAPTMAEQIRILSYPQAVPSDAFTAYRSIKPVLPMPNPGTHIIRSELDGTTLSERIKSSITVYDFVSQYVNLNQAGRGLCPFHEDHIRSFAVNLDGNYWHCFSGCGGGSIIDFWMKKQKCDFTSAVRELAKILL